MSNKKIKFVECDTSDFPKLEIEKQSKITKSILGNTSIKIILEKL